MVILYTVYIWMFERFKFALPQSFEAGGLEKEGVMYYAVWGAGVVLVSLFITMLPDLIRYIKNLRNVIVRVRQGFLAKTQSFLKPRI